MTDKDALAELRRLNQTFIHNFVTNDVASHDAIIHERFTCISSDGSHSNRADYLHYWATGFDPDVILYWDYRDERITIFGDVALVGATNRWIRVRDGAEVVGMTTYTDTYLREGGRWRCIQAQLTAVQPAHYPPDSTIVRSYIRGQLQPV